MSEEDHKKTRRIDLTKTGDHDATYTAAPTGTGGTEGTGGLSGASTGTELVQPPDRFTLIAVLGEGTQGEVCKAFDNLLERHVAIKFPHRVGDEETAREILVEARKAARLNHPNVVTIYEVGFWKNRPFIAMELVDGVSLATVIKECGRISVERYSRYARQILKALQAAHESGIVHRDLKPHNVLLAGDGTLKLTDFGIAHVQSRLSGKDSVVNNAISGTPAYMAPEQWLGKKPDARSDIYAFGCLSYKLLAGKNVFPSEDMMQHHLETPAPRLRALAPHVPENLDAILMRCLAKKPASRFQSSQELLHAIDAASEDGNSPGTAQWPAEPKAAKTGKVAMIVIALLLIVVGWFGLTQKGKEQATNMGAALGLMDKQPKEEEKQEPVVKEISESEEKRAQAERDGKALLVQAREATTPRDKISLAEQAYDLLPANSEERREAKTILEAAKEKQRVTTEKMVRTDFERYLAEAKKLRSEGKLVEAEAQLQEAQSLYDSTDYLRGRGNELKTIKMPLFSDLADASAESGQFDLASSYFDEAGRIADMLKNKNQRDRCQIEAETCRKLNRLQQIVETQPRLVLYELRDMNDLAKRLPATLLVEAQAWREIGALNRARKALVTFLTENGDSPLVKEAKLLKDSLNP
ncbi:MAG: hypothetical protein ACI97A_001882 [Planctomycetota bacterium]|jgi:hypothetical protein